MKYILADVPRKNVQQIIIYFQIFPLCVATIHRKKVPRKHLCVSREKDELFNGLAALYIIELWREKYGILIDQLKASKHGA